MLNIVVPMVLGVCEVTIIPKGFSVPDVGMLDSVNCILDSMGGGLKMGGAAGGARLFTVADFVSAHVYVWVFEPGLGSESLKMLLLPCCNSIVAVVVSAFLGVGMLDCTAVDALSIANGGLITVGASASCARPVGVAV